VQDRELITAKDEGGKSNPLFLLGNPGGKQKLTQYIRKQ
jgi:hypothetical protein